MQAGCSRAIACMHQYNMTVSLRACTHQADVVSEVWNCNNRLAAAAAAWWKMYSKESCMLHRNHQMQSIRQAASWKAGPNKPVARHQQLDP